MNRIVFESEESTGLIKGVSFGTLAPTTVASKTLLLVSSGTPGLRTLDISVRSKTVVELSADRDEVEEPDSCEILQTLHIPVTRPFASTSTTAYHRTTGHPRPLLDLAQYDRGAFNPTVHATIATDLTNVGKWPVEIQRVSWISEVGLLMYITKAGGAYCFGQAEDRAQLLFSSLKSSEDAEACSRTMSLSCFDLTERELPSALCPSDSFAIVHRFAIDTEDDGEDSEDALPCPGVLDIHWRRYAVKRLLDSL